VSSEELKRLTNEMKNDQIKFYAQDPTGQNKSNVLLSESYSWEWKMDALKQIEQPPFPNVFLTDYSLSHRTYIPLIFQKILYSTEFQYWLKDRNCSSPLPKFRIFQNAKEMHGKRDNSFLSNIFRQDSSLLKNFYTDEMDFMELDEFLLSMAKFENYTPNSDGWHTMGALRQMEIVVLMNMICNDWLVDVHSSSP
jgi:hypothetical protein